MLSAPGCESESGEWENGERTQEEYKAKKVADAAAAAAGPTNKIIAAPVLTTEAAAAAAAEVKPEVKEEPAPAAKDMEKDVAAVTEAVKALVAKMLPHKSASARCAPLPPSPSPPPSRCRGRRCPSSTSLGGLRVLLLSLSLSMILDGQLTEGARDCVCQLRASEFLAELDGPKATRKHGHDEAHVRAMADRRREKELEAREREAIRPSSAAMSAAMSLPPPPPLSSAPSAALSAASQSLPLPPPPPKAPADAASSRVAEAERAAAWERDKARQVNRRDQQVNDARYAQEEKMWELRERDKYVS